MKKAIKTTKMDMHFDEYSKMALMEALPTEYERYLNPNRLYIAHFGSIPCESNIIGINCSAAAKWFVKHYHTEIIQEYRKRLYVGSPSMSQVIFCLHDRILLQFNFQDEQIMILYNISEATRIEHLIKGLGKFQKEATTLPQMWVLVQTNGGLDTELVLLHNYNLNIDTHYNDDFKEVHQIIYERLSTPEGKGMVLLHGAPGTGKTSYLRHLIGSLDKHVIFIPPSIATEIAEPALLALLMDHKDSIFVIEDAESLISSRENSPYSPVSAILNICDGLMSDFLKIQVVCTFNTDISKIDRALLRKGRLIAKYEFKNLSAEKAQVLSDQLGYHTRIDQPMPLSAIYGQNERDFEQSRHVTIGFKATQSTV